MSFNGATLSPLHTRVIGPALFREALEQSLACDPGITVVETGYRVALLLPWGWQESLTTLRREEQPRPLPVVLVLAPEPAEIVRAYRAGISALVAISEPRQVVVDALRAAAKAKAYCSPGIVASLVESHDEPVPDSLPTTLKPRPQLTNEEMEVTALVMRGLTDAAIGKRLCISPATVKYHLRKVLRKLGAARRGELAYLMLKDVDGLRSLALEESSVSSGNRA